MRLVGREGEHEVDVLDVALHLSVVACERYARDSVRAHVERAEEPVEVVVHRAEALRGNVDVEHRAELATELRRGLERGVAERPPDEEEALLAVEHLKRCDEVDPFTGCHRGARS